MFSYLTTLANTTVQQCTIPLSRSYTLPEFKTKDAYRKWSIDKDTDHLFLSPFVGIIESQRISENNVPLSMGGFIADYDAANVGDVIAQIVANTEPGLRPQWVARSYSGYYRLYYTFEQPILFGDEKVVPKFLDFVIRSLECNAILPGFDRESCKKLSQYFEVGTDWKELPDSLPIPLCTLETWMVKAIMATSHSSKGKLIASFDDVRTALAEKYPGGWDWDKFAPGARGNRLWDGGNASSCIVREDGITCFTGDKPFVSWADLLSKEWVDKNTEKQVGQAIESIYFDQNSNKYWRKLNSVGWQPVQKEDLKLHFRMHGISDDKPKSEFVSPVERLLHQVQMTHAVAGTFPFHYEPREVLTVSASPFLNTSRARLAQPDASRSGRWADGFPNIAAYYEGLYDLEFNATQFARAMAEMSHFYCSAFEGKLARGRVMMHAGPAGVGKSYGLNILSEIFGGAEDASRYLCGLDAFNGSLINVPVWVVDDPVAATDHKSNMVFSQMLKSIAACDNIPVRGMFKESLRLPWLGRVVVNMNDDPESIRMLPSTEVNLMDKVALFAVKKPFEGVFPSDAVVKSEIPAFCQFMLEGRDWIDSLDPGVFTADARWGVRRYHHPRLISAAQSAQNSTSVEELLRIWRTTFFNYHQEKLRWVGNPTQLLDEMTQIDSLRDIYRSVINGPQALSRALAQLCLRENAPGWIKNLGSGREYAIYKNDNGATEDVEPF